jgi:hypothetical protein
MMISGYHASLFSRILAATLARRVAKSKRSSQGGDTDFDGHPGEGVIPANETS